VAACVSPRATQSRESRTFDGARLTQKTGVDHGTGSQGMRVHFNSQYVGTSESSGGSVYRF
jgi:hypothetical protein